MRNDNSGGGGGLNKAFDFPFDCLSAMNGGRGCWGEMHTFRNGGSSAWSSPIRLQFIDDSGSWFVQANRGDSSGSVRAIGANDNSVVNTTSDTGHCHLRTTTAGTKDPSVGFNNFNLRASGGSYCYLRLCETQLPSVQIP